MTLGDNGPSWYQISVSQGQLAGAFVAALVLLVSAFVFGFLAGRSGPESAPAATVAAIPAVEPDDPSPYEAPGGAASAVSPSEPSTAGDAVALGDVPPATAAAPPEPVVVVATEESAPSRADREESPVPGEPKRAASSAPAAAKTGRPAPEKAASRDEPAGPGKERPAASAGKDPAAAGGFTVQVAALGKKKDAETLRDKLARRYSADVVVHQVTRDGKALWRVQVGRYTEKETAEKMASRLKGAEKSLTAVHVVPR